MISVRLREPATKENFDAAAYLRGNPDVAKAVMDGRIASAEAHFEHFGNSEKRELYFPERAEVVRPKKMERLQPHLLSSLPCRSLGHKLDFISDELRAQTGISSTENVSSWGYDPPMEGIIRKYSSGLILDCGAGSKNMCFDHVVCMEIVNYPSTDVLGVGEALPFKDNTFDAVCSVAVLEHVRDPFQCAKEISRVLKPGGELYCAMPFLQPYHGYPHHYFNATGQGLRRLFEDDLEIVRQEVHDGMKPLATLQWILNSWAAGLSPAVAENFSNMTVGELLSDYQRLLERPFCRDLAEDKIYELASATVITATKQP